MKLYRLECIDQYGIFEINGYFIYEENAKQRKNELDSHKENKRYGIEQNIVEIETED